jgi:hypothetical protein
MWQSAAGGGGGGFDASSESFNGQWGGVGGSTPKASGSDRKRFEDAVNYLRSRKGWPQVAATGIAANLYGESNLNPASVNRAGGGQGAQGIAQWRSDRINEIVQRSGKPIPQMSLYEQLDAVDYELRSGKHITKNGSIPNGTEPIAQALASAQKMEDVVQQMVYRYERPGNMAGETKRRIGLAYSLMSKLDEDLKSKSATSQKGGTKGTSGAQAAPAKTATKPTKPVDPKWATALTNGVNNLNSTIGKMSTGNTSRGGSTTHSVRSSGQRAAGSNLSTMSARKIVVRTGA